MKFRLFCATYSDDGNQWMLMADRPIFPVNRMSGVVVNMLSDQIGGTWQELWDIIWNQNSSNSKGDHTQ